MNTLSGTHGRNAHAIVAALLAIVFVGLLALALTSRDGSTDSASDGPRLAEPALAQGARYPQPKQKYAPGRTVQTVAPTRATAQLAGCQGEGLVDTTNRAALGNAAGVTASACGPTAYPAGGASKPRQPSPMGEGRLNWEQRR